MRNQSVTPLTVEPGRLTPPLRQRVIGATYHSAMNKSAFQAKSRCRQILDDVARRQPSDWLALDNDANDWIPEHFSRLVLTDDVNGINQKNVLEDLQRKLARMMSTTD